METIENGYDARLAAALADWLGLWPPRANVDVVGSRRRAEPAWNGRVYPAIGVASRESMVLSVPPDRVDAVAALAPGTFLAPDRWLTELGAAVGRPGNPCVEWVFRWSTAPAALPDVGVWLPADAAEVPVWLRSFGGEVLVARDDAGQHLGGVGIKRHTRLTHEMSIVVARQARRQGIGRRLVAQAARRALAAGAVPLYLHARVNVASGRLAEAAGFPDEGWHMYELAEAASSTGARWAYRGRAALRSLPGLRRH